MHSAVISDASCLIVLQQIQALDLLFETYGQITTTPEIVSEIRFALPSWVVVRSPTDPTRVQEMPRTIDAGEASAIALALETPNSVIIIDERTARRYAKKLGLNLTGTLGVIVKAKVDGVIPSIRPFITALRGTDFRISEAIEKDAYDNAGEVQT